MQTIESLNHLRNECVKFVRQGWDFIGWIALEISYPYYPSSHTILLDDPSFPDLVLNSLKLQSQDTSRLVLMAITSIAAQFDHLKEKFVKVKLVGRMFETVDFVSLPLSESQTLLQLTDFIDRMFIPIGVERQIRFEQYRLIRVSVFEPAKQFIVFMFKNSSKLVLRKESKTRLDYNLCRIHNHVSGMELRPDKQDGDLVSELVKYEMRTMVEMEKESNCLMILESMLNKTNEWNRNKPERQKRREVLLREEGWDDALELRVVGMETITDQRIRDDLKRFRVKMAFNVNKF
ncbi:hypothetical protein BLNAU_7265 [Blattamonas nauphoetae]|uniref:Uncharacterized protein n=1 Tax=Blattamonas nauphoetae TaxID=2049346 RepID=A0ABQ9Y267_9EUKA|nr:hypothetical protein BLNAU_7265 [Blattamonas nauphoetae]